MRKKGILILPLLALMFFGAACHNSSQSADNSSVKTTKSSKKKSESSKTENTDKKSDDSSVTSKSSSSDKTSQSSQPAATSSSSSSATSEAPSTENRLEMITSSLKRALPGEKFPQSGISNNLSSLNGAYVGNVQNYTVSYYTTGAALNFNDTSLSNQQAAATFQKQTYASAGEAQAAINYQAPESGLPTVALDSEISATQQGAAGSSYLNWTEGRWSILSRASSVNGENGLPLAKQVVALLHTQMLPVPDVHGAISLYVSSDPSSRMNTVIWSKGNAVYTVAAADPMIAIQMATSLQ